MSAREEVGRRPGAQEGGARPLAQRATTVWILSPAANAFIGLLGLLTATMLARALGPEARGILAEAMLWPTLVLTAGSLVNLQTIVYFWSKARPAGATSSVLGVSLALAAILTLALAPAAAIVNYAALGAAGKASYALANLFVLSIPLALFSFTFLSPFLAEDRAGAYWILRVTAPALCLFGISVLAVRHDGQLRHYIFVILGASAVQVLAGLSLASALLLRRPTWDSPLFRRTLGFGLRTNLTTLPYQINLRIDQFFVSGLLSPADLGQYTVAFTWSSVLSFIGGGLSVAVLARATQVSAADTGAMRALFRRFRLVCACLVVMGALAALLTPPCSRSSLARSSGPPSVRPWS